MPRIKIVVDADVLIHFSKAGHLFELPQIFPEYDYVILDTVYKETKTIRNEIDNICNTFHSIQILPFNPRGEMLREYAMLIKNLGKGESACMSYCRFTRNVVGSSNLRDIKNYCEKYQITYLTTMDFFYYAWRKKILTEEEVKKAISDIKAKGSRLPDQDITKYVPNVDL